MIIDIDIGHDIIMNINVCQLAVACAIEMYVYSTHAYIYNVIINIY